MLSPGRYFEAVPRDPQENLRYRKYVLDRCEQNHRFRDAVLEQCRDDLFYYVNVFGWQYNPLLAGREVGPFITWDFQVNGFRTILNCIDDQRDLCIEKSREMGATWMCLFVGDWHAKLHKNKQIGVMSRDADAVDDGTLNSLMPKLDFITDHQPDWLVGEVTKKVKGFVRRYERTKSIWTGEASTGKAFVSGRLSWLFVDEYSQIDDGRKVRVRTAAVTKTRIFNFTHVGSSGHAYDLANEAEVRKLVIHWTDHPYKIQGLYSYDPEQGRVVAHDKSYHFPADYPFVIDGSPKGGPHRGMRSPWYDEECKRIGNARSVAEELDIDPGGAGFQFFDPVRVRKHKQDYAVEPVWTGELEYADGEPKELQQGYAGSLKLWVLPDVDGRPPKGRYFIGCDPSQGTGATNSALCIGRLFENGTGEQVGELANPNLKVDLFADYAVALCRLFEDEYGDGAMLSWEIQGAVGKMFSDQVTLRRYSRVHFEFDHQKNKMNAAPGFSNNSNRALKPLLRDFESSMNTGQFVVRSEEMLDELLNFHNVQGGGVEHMGWARGEKDDPSGARENHGDRGVAGGQVVRMMRQASPVGSKKEDRRGQQGPEWGSFAWRKGLRGADDEGSWLDWTKRGSSSPRVTVWSASDARAML